MKCGHAGWCFVLTLLLSVSLARTAACGIINGDFATGDLTGWTASAIDGLSVATTPLVSVASIGGNQLALFDTGEFASGPFISTLEQSFVVDPANPFLSFDFSRLLTALDPSGAGGALFPDAFAVTLASGGSFYDLLLVDPSGPLADPFGTAPGAVALGTPLSSGLEFNFSADLSSLAGLSVSLFGDLVSADDGLRSTVQFDNVVLQDELITKAVIPEPASLTLWSVLVLGSAAAGRRWRKEPISSGGAAQKVRG